VQCQDVCLFDSHQQDTACYFRSISCQLAAPRSSNVEGPKGQGCWQEIELVLQVVSLTIMLQAVCDICLLAAERKRARARAR